MKKFSFKKKEHSTLLNPFVSGAEGKSAWNDRYMNLAKSVRNWQIAFTASMIITVLMTLVVAKLALSSHIQPYVVETQQGMPTAIKPMQAISSKDTMIVNYAVNQFIINARTILQDATAQRNLLSKVYAYSADATMPFLQNYYEKNNPLQLAAQYTTTVHIVNVLSLSDHTMQVTWDEVKHNLQGGVMDQSRWVAHLTYQFGDVNTHFINENPFGLYITHVTWSQSQNSQNA